MAERRVILLEHDDLMHPNTGESNFNESAYYNFSTANSGSVVLCDWVIGPTRAPRK